MRNYYLAQKKKNTFELLCRFFKDLRAILLHGLVLEI